MINSKMVLLSKRLLYGYYLGGNSVVGVGYETSIFCPKKKNAS
jgi:hypothetical protein